MNPIPVTNGIGQGDPLSMLLYIIYNADLIDIPTNPESEDALGYVDDIAIITIGVNLTETTNRLKNIMTNPGGGLNWSKAHNSKFEVNKSAIMHLTRKTIQYPDNNIERIPIPRPELVLEGQIVKEVQTYKYLGVIIDSRLNWTEQAQWATANATKWILQFCRLTKPSTGIKLKLLQQIITTLFNYVSFFLGNNAEQTTFLEGHVKYLKGKMKELQSKPAVPPTIPHPTPQQPLCPTKSIRCKYCSAVRHDTNDCHSKDLIAIKKRVTNNQKARKRNMMQDHPLPRPPVPPSTSSVHFGPDGPTNSFGNQIYYNRRTSTY